ncbi:hypothetical protein Pla86_52970 (plasmid) [Planctomycetes bacterium Pla86]|nr:hypothetical protein Pla86_52970 [Planctomycetes bacterium Pla86]
MSPSPTTSACALARRWGRGARSVSVRLDSRCYDRPVVRPGRGSDRGQSLPGSPWSVRNSPSPESGGYSASTHRRMVTRCADRVAAVWARRRRVRHAEGKKLQRGGV